jgi:DNA-directed RNA polymerase subunit RPC12/RpoP
MPRSYAGAPSKLEGAPPQGSEVIVCPRCQFRFSLKIGMLAAGGYGCARCYEEGHESDLKKEITS